MKRLTHEEFLEKLKAKVPDYGDRYEILSEYAGASSKIHCKCKIDGYEWYATSANLIHNKRGCPKCGRIKSNTSKTLSHDAFISKLPDGWMNKYEILSKYINSTSPIKCKCKTCETEWVTTPKALLVGKGCSICGYKANADARRYTHEEFLSLIPEKNKGLFTVLTQYSGMFNKVTCRCNICGYEWDAAPTSLIHRKSSCPACAGVIAKTTKEFTEVVAVTNPNVIIRGTYINAKTSIKCECRICGYVWSTNPRVLLRGDGCPKCKESHGERKISEYLDSKGIEYTKYFSADELRGVGRKPLSYDFYISSLNAFIEFQGEQHYRPVAYFGGEDSYKVQVEHDNRKRDYALLNGYHLLAIPYYEEKSIPQILDDFISNLNVSNDTQTAKIAV